MTKTAVSPRGEVSVPSFSELGISDKPGVKKVTAVPKKMLIAEKPSSAPAYSLTYSRTRPTPVKIQQPSSWYSGPLDPTGKLFDSSDRNVYRLFSTEIYVP
jgi:hypothetical protein